MIETKPPFQLNLMRIFFCWCLCGILCTLVSTTKNSSTNAPENEVCYPQIGCFSLASPWTGFWRTAAPQSPDDIRIEFNLMTRNTEDKTISECKVTTSDFGVPNMDSLKKLDYRNRRQITIVHIHGQHYSRKMKLTGLKTMANAYLARRDVNVIFVQWDSHIKRGYRQNVSNTRIVAAVAARFIRTLHELSDQTYNKFHLVGNSLGAHIAGYIGKIIPNTIHRITARGVLFFTNEPYFCPIKALEAAQPGFENSDPRTRLHHTDAYFVDALHTNAKPFTASLGLGYVSPIGHIDFYFNRGTFQPACSKHRTQHEVESWSWNIKRTIFKTVEDFIECSHVIVNEYWIEALQSKCVMWGRPVKQKSTNNTISQYREQATISTNGITKWTWDDEQDCALAESECSPVGWRTFKRKVKGVFHVTTNSQKPYCIWKSRKKS